MIQKDLNWFTKDSLNIFAHTWEPNENPIAAITLVHGFGEHCLRYTPHFELFTNAGIAVLGFDLRGHGQSDGKRGTIASYNALLDDVDLALAKTKELFPALPQFIYGHSMGGNIALNYILRRKPHIKGGIITSPWLALTNEPNGLLKRLVSILKNIAPNMTIDSGLDSKNISIDTNEVNKYDTDPLNHGRISFLLFHEITQSGQWAVKNANKINMPVLLMHGTADKITSPLASKKVWETNKTNVEYKEWPGGFHELHNEPNKVDVANFIIEWITKDL